MQRSTAALEAEVNHELATGNVVRVNAFTGLIFVDGVRAASDAMSRLSGEQIESVEVLKGTAASEYYTTDPAAANGVIRITTKHPKQ